MDASDLHAKVHQSRQHEAYFQLSGVRTPGQAVRQVPSVRTGTGGSRGCLLSTLSQLVAPVLEGQGRRIGCAPPLQRRVTAPMGLRNSRPQTAVRKLSGSGRRSRGTRPCLAAQMPQLCALSASASLSRWPAADAASNCRSVRSSLYAVTALTPSAPAPISSLRCTAQAVHLCRPASHEAGYLPQGGAGSNTLLYAVLCCMCCLATRDVVPEARPDHDKLLDAARGALQTSAAPCRGACVAHGYAQASHSEVTVCKACAGRRQPSGQALWLQPIRCQNSMRFSQGCS